MKINPKTVDILPSVRAVFVPAQDSKTSLITVSLLIPRDRDIGERLILPKLLCYSTKKYPGLIQLNKKLDSLYGAYLSGYSSIVGDSSNIELSITCIDNRYCLFGEDIKTDCLELLLDALFEPDAENGAFDSAKTELHKRLAVKSIEGEINRKRHYAFIRMIEIMCEDELYGISRQEKLDSVNAVTPESLYCALRTVLEEATVQFHFIGDFDEQSTVEMIKKRFSSVDRHPADNASLYVECAEDVTEVTETMNVNQTNLVMGFRTGMKDREDSVYAYQMFVDMLGGGVYSLLFKNVREKLSLCYFCSTSLLREKGIITIQSGIEAENRQKVIDEIMKQIKAIQTGDFDDELINASRISICDALNGVLDTPDSIDNFLSKRIKDKEIYPIEETIRRYKAVTREDIIAAANRISMDTVYTLTVKGDGADE